MQNIGIEQISLAVGFILLLLGIWGMISQKNILKIIVSFTIFETGINVILVAIGYIRNKTAPILDSPELQTDTAEKIVDPLPQALVLTSIVIGLGVTALLLVYALKMYKQKKTLLINDYKDTKW
ncbi:MAG: cation:proton antiporter subunit C [Bacteroidales bacterium]|nr:cation:proton antiporter subunit C [Bacteroidales bacterium]MDD4217063.1 cation:proton antiporter subunit C [Bacteroidales bacterium]MDY0142497.1 cation:proton antiporter subunit C [Bacteroidales bacterium]